MSDKKAQTNCVCSVDLDNESRNYKDIFRMSALQPLLQSFEKQHVNLHLKLTQHLH